MATVRGLSAPIPNLKEYTFGEKLGSGTYAVVYKAYRKVLMLFIYLDVSYFKCER